MTLNTTTISKVFPLIRNGACISQKDNASGIPITRIETIASGNLNYQKVGYADITTDKFHEYYLKNGDILMSHINSWAHLGKSALVKESKGKIIHGMNLLLLRADHSLIDPLYAKYYFESNRFKIQLNKISNQSVNQSSFSISKLKLLEFPLQDISTQQRIAEILGKADALREKDQQLLRHYDDLAQSLFNDMFGDPVRNVKGWEVKKLGELSTKILSGNTPIGGSNVYVDDGITFFRSQNVWKNELIYDDIAYIDNATHLKMKNTSLLNLDILITKTGRINTENSSLGRAALFVGKDNSANINGHVYLIRLKKDNSHRFILKILTSKEYRQHIRNVCVGGIDKRQLNKEHIQNFPIIYPPIELQNQFAEHFENIEQQKQKVKEQSHKSEKLFQTLLQQAFNGELN
ncbi:restriction endonuclease subunit S [Mucilaginibacter sp. 21P]|uniref:restriction endonuclease subunit S n=1 Tax=Mucilaginibacter sp. 21P TaxID=2778902 RepID=UPI001C58F829|nr:restriction endonuclease subunit S [Mucilaginibacter sp. 21P]QXV66317.1 restriction endonuclease subunit S [Mucilaginibacter sp. 21P]